MSTPPSPSAEAGRRNREALDTIRQSVASRAPRLVQFGVVAVVWSYIVGIFGLSFLWLLLPCVFLLLIWREQRVLVVDSLVNEISQRLFRQRAFRKAESAEWANILLNRWWAVSSESLFETFTTNLNPLLNDFKPSIIDSIELSDIQLGGHTPFVKDVSILEVPLSTMGNPDVQVLNPESSQLLPPNLWRQPCKHQVIVNATVGFAAPNATLSFKTKVKTVGAVLAIQLENFHFNAQTQLVLTMDSEAPFPHFTNLSFTFLSKPDVWLNIRVLKGLQIMQLPIIKNWLHSLIMDGLKETLVDPYRYSMDITNKQNDSMVSKGDQAVGVLTVVIENEGLPTSDNLSCWCSLRVSDQKYKTTVAASRSPWKSAYSFLCHNPQEESLLLKVITRKMMRKSTLLEHMTSLSQLAPKPSKDDVDSRRRRNCSSTSAGSSAANSRPGSSLDNDRSCETISRKHNLSYRGGQLGLDVSYSPLRSVAEVSSRGESTAQAGETTGVECCSGVMYVCMHSGTDLIAMDDDGTSDPYCVLMANKRKVFTSNFQANTLNPTWEQGVEFFTSDYRKARLTFMLYDWDGRVSGDDFLGMISLTLAEGETRVLRRHLYLEPHPSDSTLLTSAFTSTVQTDSTSSDPGSPGRAGHSGGNRLSSAFHRLRSVGAHDGKNRFRSSTITSDSLSLGSVCVSVIFRPVKSVALSETSMTVASTEAEVAEFALQGGLNLARLEGTGATETVPDRVAFGLASPGVLHVTIHQAKELVAKDRNGKSDPYCVVKIGRETRYKTRVIPKSLFPLWEESFTIACLKADQKLSVICLDKDTLSDDALGTLEFDMNMITNCPSGPSWFSLQKVSRGSLQLSFSIEKVRASPPSSADSSAVSSSSALAGGGSGSNAAAASPWIADDSTGSEQSATGLSSADRHDISPTAAAAAKGRAAQLRQTGHTRSRSADSFPSMATSAAAQVTTTTDSPSTKGAGHSGSFEQVSSPDRDQDGAVFSMDSSLPILPSESDGAVRQRRPKGLSTPAGSGVSSLSRPRSANNASHLFFLSGTVIKAEGLKGDADSLELYVKIRLNSRSLVERPQPFSRGPEIFKTRRIKGTLSPEWRETFQVEEAAVSSDSLVTVDLKSGKKTTIGTQSMVLDKFMDGKTQRTKWLDMGNDARLELSLACQHAPPSPNSRTASIRRSGSLFRRNKH